METNFFSLYDDNIIKSVNGIIKETTKVKVDIFKTITMNKDLDKSLIRRYLSAVNEYLRFWEDYSHILSEKLKTTKGVEGIRTIEYGYVKDFVYGKYDYASILQFTDAVMDKIESKEIKKTSDIEDFFSYCVQEAFNDQPDTTAGLLNSVLVNGSDVDTQTLVDKSEASLFNSIKNYKKLFDDKSRMVIYKAIAKTIEFISDQLPALKVSVGDDDYIRINISMINYILEYINYTLAAYATRIYVIARYSYPFIFAYGDTITAIHESVKNNTDKKDNDKDYPFIEVNVLQSHDDIICKDPNKYVSFMELLKDFAIAVDAKNDAIGKIKVSNQFISYMPPQSLADNMFMSKIMTNEFIEFIIHKRYEIFPYTAKTANTTELQNILKEMLYNNKQGISGTATARQEILHTIRGVNPKLSGKPSELLEGYQKLAADLYCASVTILGNIKSLIDNVIKWKNEEDNYGKHDLGSSTAATEDLRMLRDAYVEFAGAIFDKGRNIEKCINLLRKAESIKEVNDISVPIPGETKDCPIAGFNNDMMKSVPDTTRVPVQITDLYALPQYESMRVYDEYLSTLPEFQDSFYYTEAFNVVDVINKIIAFISGRLKSFTNFFSNQGVINAVNWTKNHKEDLLALNFDGKSMQALNYKNNITLPGGNNFTENFINGLNKFNKDVLSSEESANEFIKSLYNLDGSNVVYGWWYETKDDPKGEEAARKYKNWILFFDNLVDCDKTVEVQQFEGNVLTNELKVWVETVSTANEIKDAYAKLSKSVTDSINKIKSEIASIQKESNNKKQNDLKQQQEEANKTAGNTNNEVNNNQQATETNNQANNMATADGANTEKFVNEIMLAQQRLFLPISIYYIEAIKNSYKYLKEAYGLTRNNPNGQQ